MKEEMLILEPVSRRLRASREPDACWLWCLHCERFFQAGSLANDPLGRREGCPFEGCGAAGLGIMLFLWDDFREPADPRWPRSPGELEHGMRSPEMSAFYGAPSGQRKARVR